MLRPCSSSETWTRRWLLIGYLLWCTVNVTPPQVVLGGSKVIPVVVQQLMWKQVCDAIREWQGNAQAHMPAERAARILINGLRQYHNVQKPFTYSIDLKSLCYILLCKLWNISRKLRIRALGISC